MIVGVLGDFSPELLLLLLFFCLFFFSFVKFLPEVNVEGTQKTRSFVSAQTKSCGDCGLMVVFALCP